MKLTDKNLEGKAWGSLSDQDKNKLLQTANPIDGRTGNKPEGSGKCIVDFEKLDVSIAGELVGTSDGDEYIILDDAIFYNSFL